jgi:hypothetical protein
MSVWGYKTRLSENIGTVDLTSSELSCKKNRKWDNFKGYFHLNSQEYYLSSKFNSCQDFKTLVQGNKLIANYLKGNNLIIDFYINNKAYYQETKSGVIFNILFLTILSWVFLRIPIKWFVRKYT